MKYIKCFEELGSKFTKIREKIYDQWVSGQKNQIVKFSNSEFNKIVESLNEYSKEFDIIPNGDVINIKQKESGFVSYIDYMEVIKFDDDWWIVRLDTEVSKYYKCDQIDGLIECILYIAEKYWEL
jgi:hypothetical protein